MVENPKKCQLYPLSPTRKQGRTQGGGVGLKPPP